MEKEKAGVALCPYDPQHNSTAVYVGEYPPTSRYQLYITKHRHRQYRQSSGMFTCC